MQDAVELTLLFILFFSKNINMHAYCSHEKIQLFFLLEGNEHTKNENRYFLAPAQRN